MALYDIVAGFVHATTDEVVAVLPSDCLLERDECSLQLKAVWHSQGFVSVAAAFITRVLKRFGWRASAVILRACVDATEMTSWRATMNW